jgi:hypothetical protein
LLHKIVVSKQQASAMENFNLSFPPSTGGVVPQPIILHCYPSATNPTRKCKKSVVVIIQSVYILFLFVFAESPLFIPPPLPLPFFIPMHPFFIPPPFLHPLINPFAPTPHPYFPHLYSSATAAAAAAAAAATAPTGE